MSRDPFSPASDVIRWVEECVGPDARVASIRVVSGGVANRTHELMIATPRGRRLAVILRRPGRSNSQPGTLEREAATLAHVAHHASHIPVPEVVAHASDIGGSEALLMTKLPGDVDLAPADRDRFLDRQAQALAAIHDIPPVPERDMELEDRVDFSRRTAPSWSAHPGMWREALAAIADSHETRARFRGFVHGDYQLFNLLWLEGSLTGIVDWSGWTLRHPDADTGHCRLALVILFGPDWAEEFRRRYEAIAGRAVDPWWDLVETCRFLPTWSMFLPDQVAGRIPFEVDAMHRRVDAYLPIVLNRLAQ